ncbi:hypothetical protein GQ600_24524 [Phytophthora cactorum]|nr:hypothetical protein GQ600_24524 [Phytophthora cactorum]
MLLRGKRSLDMALEQSAKRTGPKRGSSPIQAKDTARSTIPRSSKPFGESFAKRDGPQNLHHATHSTCFIGTSGPAQA